jgi:hypothetical protein
MKLQKFRHRSIDLCSHVRSPSLLPHVNPSALKRSESAFLFVVHIAPVRTHPYWPCYRDRFPPGLRRATRQSTITPRRNEGQQNAVCLSVLYLFDQKFPEMAPMMHKTATKQLNA